MGRHRSPGEAEFFDEDGLRPATVEELAAQERAAKPTHRSGGHRKPLLVALSTSALLVTGAGAFALARTDDPAVMVEPSGAAAPFGVSYKDGFGEHTPKPSPTPAPSKSTSKRPSPQSPYSAPGPNAPPSLGTLLGSSATPGAPTTSSGKEDGAAAVKLSAVHWEMTFQDHYWVYIWVNNAGSSAATWQVDLKLPKNASVTSAWEVNRSNKGNNTWAFTSAKGPLGAGRTYLFAVEGISSDPFVLQSCTVNGVACAQFG